MSLEICRTKGFKREQPSIISEQTAHWVPYTHWEKMFLIVRSQKQTGFDGVNIMLNGLHIWHLFLGSLHVRNSEKVSRAYGQLSVCLLHIKYPRSREYTFLNE